MAESTQIEWTDATWNPMTGCTKVTAGCDFCYAERFSERFRGVKGHPFENGFDLTIRPARLNQPRQWRQSRRVFVNSMSDLFHKEVPVAFIDAVFDTMEGADWHTYQVLTKRSSLMARYLRRRRETLKAAGKFTYVVSTRIDKSTQNRPHFFLAYATKDRAGLKAFREIEFRALRTHARARSAAMARKRETRSGTPEMFAEFDADHREASIDELVAEQKQQSKEFLLTLLVAAKSIQFTDVADTLLQAFMLRETNVKDVCVELAREGKIENTWGSGTRKPNDQTQIVLARRE